MLVYISFCTLGCIKAPTLQLLINYSSKIAVSNLVNSLKGVSSRLIRKKKHSNIEQAFWSDSLWFPSYFAGACGGTPLEVIYQYIEQQH